MGDTRQEEKIDTNRVLEDCDEKSRKDKGVSLEMVPIATVYKTKAQREKKKTLATASCARSLRFRGWKKVRIDNSGLYIFLNNILGEGGVNI